MTSQVLRINSLRRETSFPRRPTTGPSTPTTPNRVRFENIPDNKPKQRRRSSRRSVSGSEPTFMSPLSFEEIDVKNTPLSSLRSCSEYQRQQSDHGKGASSTQTLSKSFWSSLFGFSSKENDPPPTNQAPSTPAPSSSSRSRSRVRLNQVSTEESMFLVEKLRFNQANLYEGEDYFYSNEDTGPSQSCFNLGIHNSQNHTSNSSGNPGNFHYQSQNSRRIQPYPDASASFLGESTMAFDYLFGLRLVNQTRQPMEIELKCLSEPRYYNSYPATSTLPGTEEESDRPEELIEGEGVDEADIGPSTTVSTLRRIPSLRNLDRNGGLPLSDHEPMSPTRSDERLLSSPLVEGTTYRLLLRKQLEDYQKSLLLFLKRRFPSSRGDDLFYESIRLQPFASGAYLRCMLLAGLSSMFFQIYNVFTWPNQEKMMMMMSEMNGGALQHHQQSWWSYSFEMILFVNLLIQIVLNLCQLPFRLRIHFLCWESSRALEVDAAITIIRDMLQSESWLLNKALGKMTDIMILVNLALTEVFLWCSGRDDPLRSLMISLCATNMLTIVARVLVATIFSFSMHDPHVLSEARRRGLSKWDLEVLPTFLFSRSEEVNNCDCPICLCGFEMGEMLISLPCDAKHSFHANCIRQWLQRQNSCPLCNKLV